MGDDGVKSLTIENNYGIWLEAGLGPHTLGRIVNLPADPDLPDWNTLQGGVTLQSGSVKHDLGLMLGADPASHSGEFGLFWRPRHSGHGVFRPQLGLVWTEFGQEGSLGRLSPALNTSLSLPLLNFGGSESGVAFQPFVDASLFFGWDADPIRLLEAGAEQKILPDLFRLHGGIRLFFRPNLTTERGWDDAKAFTLLAEEALLFYPAISAAFLIGGVQSVFVDLPYAELAYLKERQFPLNVESVSLKVKRHDRWNKFVEGIESADWALHKRVIHNAAIANWGLAATMGGITGGMILQDAALMRAARRGEISQAIPDTVLWTKAGLGAALLGLSFLGEAHPGPLPMWGGIPQGEIDSALENFDPQTAERMARHLQTTWQIHLEETMAWARDYRYRGAEYLAHSLFMQTGLGLFNRSAESESPLVPLMGITTGTILLALQSLHASSGSLNPKVWFSNPTKKVYTLPEFYDRNRVGAHLGLAASALLTYAVGKWVERAGWNIF